MEHIKEAPGGEPASPLPDTPPAAAGLDPKVWHRFLMKNIGIYAGTNIFFNSVIPYFSFEQRNAVHLFQGTYCVARFLLPLAFFIPLLITIDTGNKVQALFRKKVPDFSFPENFRFKRFLLQQSLLNSFMIFGLTLGVMAALQFGMPNGYTYHGLAVSIIMGIYAGAIALYFMKRTINQLKMAGVVKISGEKIG